MNWQSSLLAFFLSWQVRTLLNSIYSNLAELYPALKRLTDAVFKAVPHA